MSGTADNVVAAVEALETVLDCHTVDDGAETLIAADIGCVVEMMLDRLSTDGHDTTTIRACLSRGFENRDF